ncbi:MAG: GspE/PulE family protein [Candidatus Omnitrophica bacterium]|nr:GspE/PulE family protein [Candidatus Omnitrophota bacterium]MCM8778051.1 GspE/PulE family protein [Candidatus Omnitrophota bacterium]
MKRDEIIKVLIDKEHLKREQIEMVVNEKEKTGAPFGYLLIKFGLITADQWYNFVLKEIKIVPLNISGMEISKDILTSLPEFTCRKYRTIPVYKGGKKLICGMVDPLDEDVIEELKKISSMEIEPRLVKDADVKVALEKYLAQGSLKVISPVEKIETAGKVFKPSGIKEISEASAVEAVEDIIRKSIELKATDIHIEIEEEGVKLRYRINGLLYEFPPPPLELYPAIVSHIKVLSSLDIAEKRIPQDGYFKMKISGVDVDLRVSTFPTIFGEMVAMRVLNKKNIVSGLEQLGFLPQTLHSWRTFLEEPYGLLLVTGPTGSGKTTTLYSSLNELDCLHKKIITVEDPVEYHIQNVDQTQINPKAGLTFATALRSILRQDPDVVMIGEIRDRETAEIALRAAQTGQLVFSTLHTNTAPAAPVRLIDMGIEPYLISSSLIGVLNQRLVRSICNNCKERYKPLKEELTQIDIPPEEIEFLYRGKGCHICNGTGFGGRTGIFELMVMNEELRREIMINPEVSRIDQLARKSGMKTLREDGIIKVLDGTTTISEVLYSTKK